MFNSFIHEPLKALKKQYFQYLLSSSGSFGFCQTFDDDECFNDLLMKNADLITAKITLDVNNCLYAA